MNPFSFYEHKPQLIASTIAGVASIVVLRRRVVGVIIFPCSC